MHRTAASLVAGALAAVAVVVVPATPAAAGGGCHANGLVDHRTTSVELAGNCFSPTVARVDPGATVTWTNADPHQHDITAAGRVFGTDVLGDAATFSFTFDRPGVFPYSCTLHPGMIGVVVVGDGGTPSASAPAPATPTSLAARPAAATAPTDTSSPLLPLGLLTVAAACVAVGTRAATIRRDRP